MQDPVKTIKDLLYDNWTVDGTVVTYVELDKDNIEWVQYEHKGQILKPMIQITLANWRKRQSSGASPRTYVEQDILIIPKLPKSDNRYAYLWQMRDKIEDIIEANRTGNTDIDFIEDSPQLTREYDVFGPFKPFAIQITCVFERS